MKSVVSITIDDKKSNAFVVRGVAFVDGIEIPFTAYIAKAPSHQLSGQFDAVNACLPNNLVRVRSKSGILKKYSDGQYIRSKIRDSAKGWWIDNNFWR